MNENENKIKSIIIFIITNLNQEHVAFFLLGSFLQLLDACASVDLTWLVIHFLT